MRRGRGRQRETWGQPYHLSDAPLTVSDKTTQNHIHTQHFCNILKSVKFAKVFSYTVDPEYA